MTIMGMLFGTDRIKNAVGYLQLEVTIEEIHSFENDVTQNPVEEGEPTTDHVISLPDVVRMKGLSSTAPISEGLLNLVKTGTASLVQDDFDALYKLKEEHILVAIITPMKVYEDMIVRSIDFPRSPGDGESVQYTIECVHVRQVLSKTTELPPGIGEKQADSVEGRAKSESKKGQQQNKPASGKSVSVAKGIFK